MSTLDGNVVPPTNPDQVMASSKPLIAESALKISLGERLRRAEGPMPNIRGDRPPDPLSDE